MVAISYLIQSSHDHIDHAQHAGQRDIEIEVLSGGECDSPAEGKQQQEDDDDGVGCGVEQQIHEIEKLVILSTDMGVDEEADVLQASCTQGKPQTDLQDVLYPILFVLLVGAFQVVNGPQAEQEKRGQQPIIHGLTGRSILAVNEGLHIDLQTGSSSVIFLQYTLRAISEDEIHGACLLNLHAHLHFVLVVILLIEDNHMRGLLLVSLFKLQRGELAGIAFIGGLCFPELGGQGGEDKGESGAYFEIRSEEFDFELYFEHACVDVDAIDEQPPRFPSEVHDGHVFGVDPPLCKRKQCQEDEDKAYCFMQWVVDHCC